MKLTLYRGISVDADHVAKVCDRICTNGIVEREPLTIQYIGLKHARLSNIRALNPGHIDLRENITSSNSWSFACGDREGASFYAHRNYPKSPVLLRLSVDLKSVHIDGRDALYTAFGFCRSGDKQRKESLITTLFGKEILPYWEVAREIDSPSIRQNVAEAAAIDAAVILAHLSNKVPIFGRHKTRFCSAFAIRLPIPASSIKLVPVCDSWTGDVNHAELSILAEQ